MINRLIDVALKIGSSSSRVPRPRRLGMVGADVTPIDAIPDLSDNQVIVFADWAGHSPQEVEDQVTYPLSVESPGARRRPRRPVAVRVRLLDDLRHL